MKRIPFSQVLKNASIDLRREYDRLYELFYLQKHQIDINRYFTICQYCKHKFIHLPFRGTCVTLDDFDDYYNFHFEKAPRDFDMNYLISFCEYSYNLTINNTGIGNTLLDPISMSMPCQFYSQQVITVIESIGYMPNQQGFVTDFVPKDQVSISVAETLDLSLSYRVIEYNHHSMKGDLTRKREILLALADKLEPQGDRLKQINSSLKSDLFFLFNRINIRHNNADPSGSYYREFVSKMNDEDLEQWYDETYQMCLLAFLELDNIERKKRVEELKKDIEG